MPRKFFVNILLTLLFGCSANSDVQFLYPSREFDENIFISSIWNIQENKGTFFFNDHDNNRILIADTSLNILNSLGKTGKGPGEFQGAGSFFVYKDSVYVYDVGGMRLNVFTESGEFKRTIILPSVQLDWSRFTILNNKIYLPSAIGSDSDILILDLNGKVKKGINQKHNGSVNVNHRAILNFQDQIIALARSAPFIERYSNSGVLLEVFDLTKIRELEGLWNHYNRKKNQNKSGNTTILFEDAYIKDSFLYVLCAPWPERDDFSYIIKLLLNEDKIKTYKIFKIQGAEPSMRFFGSLAIMGDRLIAYEKYSKMIFEFNTSRIK